jgi:thiol-disulfide isomerase/thioredoxin
MATGRQLGRLAIAAAALALVLGGAGTARAASNDGWETLNVPAKAFKVTDLEGKVLDSASLKGKIVIIDFWATWCTPCVQELPELEAYKKKLAGRKDVVLLSLNVTEEAKQVRDFAQRRAMLPPIYLGDDLLGPYNVVGFPTKLILDLRRGAPGKLRSRREGGPVPLSSLEAQVQAVLAAP